MSETVQLDDAIARESALDCASSFIVQAPAGSGKTALLTQRFLRLLALVDTPESILAITFTRKAAAEMRGRIIEALRNAASGVRPAASFEAAIFEDACRALKRDAAMGWRLLDMPMRLQIMTVDALNSRLVNAMPVASRLGAVSIADDHTLTQLYDEAANALLDWLETPGKEAAQVRSFFAHIDGDAQRWRRQLSDLLRQREQWLPLVLANATRSGEELRMRSEQRISDLVLRRIQAVDRRLTTQQKNELLGLCVDARERQREAGRIAQDEAMLLPVWPSPDDEHALWFWQTIASHCLTKATKPDFFKRLTVTHGFPTTCVDEKARMMELLTELSAVDDLAELWAGLRELPEPRYTDERWALIEALLSILPLAAAELQLLMNQRGGIDYPALAASAVMGLNDADTGYVSDLALRLDYQIQHVLVDEMQDTSVSQYKLLMTLTEGWIPSDGRTLFCVGDPMQSIYRFRGAEVSRFLDAWAIGIGDVPLTRLTLTTNFRSDERIVSWVNQCFAVVMGQTADALMDQVAYSPSVPRPGVTETGRVQWHVGETGQVNPAEEVANIVANLREEYPDDSIAILCRSRAPLEPILSALQADGLAIDAVEMQRLTERPEITDLLAITRAIQHTGDRVGWLGLLRSSMVGLTFEEIDQVACRNDGPDESIETRIRSSLLEDLFSPLSSRHLDHFLSVLDEARSKGGSWSLRDQVEHVYCRLGGPALLKTEFELDNVVQFLDVIAALEVHGQIDGLGSLEDYLNQRRVSQIAQKPDVTVLTIFKSKGLEFDHVVLPALQRGARNNTKPPLFLEVSGALDNDPAVLFSVASPVAQRDEDKLHQLLNERERQRGYNELDRLLYVACTRARKTLHLVGSVEFKDGVARTPPAGTLLNRLWPIAKIEFHDQDGRQENIEDSQELSPWVMPVIRQLPSVWQVPVADWVKSSPIPVGTSEELEDEAVSFRWAGDNARHVGTVVHHWLQWLCGAKDPVEKLQAVRNIGQRHRRLLQIEGVPENAMDEAFARTQRALEIGVASDAGQWLLANQHEDSAAELALVAEIGYSTRRVVIDRVLRDEHGDLWIVDYKTSFHEGGDIEAFFSNELERYRAQLNAYASVIRSWYEAGGRETGPIRKALFFPYYGELREYDA
ncbi:MAG: UvrD-helicase domain-containing protein [Woeseiaceae bacterium]